MLKSLVDCSAWRTDLKTMKDWKILCIALVAATLSAYLGFTVSSARAPLQANSEATTPVPRALTPVVNEEARIKDLEGREHSLSEWAGKILVVNFWATWCPPCVVEIPAFIKLQTDFEARGLQFVGIALDDPQAAAKFATERAINYPILVGDDNVARLMEGLGNTIGALPYTVVFDRQGQVVHTHQGEWTPAAARQLLEPLLDPPPGNQTVAR
jgi:thiol-disulfide isomerase/thioredoxin